MESTAGTAPAPGPSAASTKPAFGLTDLSLVFMAMIWGVNYVVVKFGTTVLPALSFNAVRVVIAAVILVCVVAIRNDGWPDRRRSLALVALGVLGNGVYQVLFIQGVLRTRAGDASLVMAATPAFVALIGRARGVERVGARGWIGIFLSILGIGFVSSASVIAHTSGGSLVGDLLIVAASFCWAIYTVLLKPYTHATDGVTLSALTMVGGAIVFAIVGFSATVSTNWRAAPLTAYGAIAYSGLGALVIAYFFWYRGIRVIGPTRTAMYSNLQPIFAVLVAWLVLGEIPTVWQGVGAASIMSGLLLART
jgi:drug/metabolite transporter (DMT)-like permease